MTKQNNFKKAVSRIEQVGEQALNRLEKKVDALAEKAKEYSIVVSQDILGYKQKMVELIAARAAGEVPAVEAELAIKNWEASCKSALKKLKVFGEWEAHDQAWDAGKMLLKVTAALLGEIRL